MYIKINKADTCLNLHHSVFNFVFRFSFVCIDVTHLTLKKKKKTIQFFTVNTLNDTASPCGCDTPTVLHVMVAALLS